MPASSLPHAALAALAACTLAAATSCSGRGGPPGRRPPVARIEGASLRAGYGTLVTLDGSRSSDPDGDPLTYRWRILGSPEAAKTARHANRARFTFRTPPARARFALRPAFGPVAIPREGTGELGVELEVSDGAHRGVARAVVRSAGPTGGWPRVETGLDLTVSCGEREDAPARWELVETPAASKAVVLEPTRCLARVRADLAGRYVLAERESGRRIPFWYGDWVGHEECARPECHPREHETWRATKHASVFARGLDGAFGAGYGPACWPCHTLGSDEGGRSIGFLRAAAAKGWRPPERPGPGEYARMPAAVRLWANVQCEQCHGPGRFWTGLSAEACAQCHDAPPRYRIVADWRTSRMSIPPAGATAARADCATCHSAHGGVGRLDGATRVRPKEEPEPQGISCPVCHDPHEARSAVQLRRFGEVTLAGRTVTAGRSAVCFACHGAFEGESSLGTDGTPAPHAPQGYMLVTPAPGQTAAPHAAVPDLCVGCHMRKPTRAPREARPTRAGLPSADAVGGHTFRLRSGQTRLDDACRPCHADVRGLEVGGGRAARALADDTARLRARLQAAVAGLPARACDGSVPVDLVAQAGTFVLVDALGRRLEDCAHVALPPPTAALARAAILLTVLERDRSRGAHNLPLARALVDEGLALLPASGAQSAPP